MRRMSRRELFLEGETMSVSSKFPGKNAEVSRAVKLALASALFGAANVTIAQTASSTQSGEAAEDIQEVVVTGFRASLNAALTNKKDAVGAIDSIQAEDIAKFPDSNLAESMQRIP